MLNTNEKAMIKSDFSYVIKMSLQSFKKKKKSGSLSEENDSRGTNAEISRQGKTDRQALFKSSHDRELRVLCLDKAVGVKEKKKCGYL